MAFEGRTEFMKIGIDFGTTHTKIAYIDENGKLQLFAYPSGNNEQKCILSSVAYWSIGNSIVCSIGKSAYEYMLNYENVVYCENFKPLLALKNSKEWQQHGWSDKAPAPKTTAIDYLRKLLCDDDYSFEQFHHKISKLVLSVPELWKREPNNTGIENLKLVANELKLPLDHLQSEPVCAAAYYAYRHQELEATKNPFNLLVCDIGGRVFDVTLCQVTESNINVLNFDGDIGHAGEAFVYRAACKMWTATHSENPDPHDLDFIEVLQKLKSQILGVVSRIHHVIEVCRSYPEEHIPVYQIKHHHYKYTLSLSQLNEIFLPFKKRIIHVLGRFQERLLQLGFPIDRIAIVGGFGQFPLVKETILDFWQYYEMVQNKITFDETIGKEQGAVAFGAALIANGIISPFEAYPHAIGIRGIAADLETEMMIPIIEAGQVLKDYREKVYFAQHKLSKKPVTCRILTDKLIGSLPVFIKIAGKGDWKQFKLRETPYPPSGRYKIGFSISQENLVTLIFEPTDGEDPSKRRIYSLSELDISDPIKIERFADYDRDSEDNTFQVEGIDSPIKQQDLSRNNSDTETSIQKTRALRIFLCHTSNDKAFVRKIYQQLRQKDLDPWLDEEKIVGGQDWDREIRRAISNSDIIVVCLSKQSINKKGYVQKEINIALDVAETLPEDSIFVVPLKLEECSIPDRLQHLHYVDFFEKSGHEKLMRAIEFRAAELGIGVMKVVSHDNIQSFEGENNRNEKVFYTNNSSSVIRILFLGVNPVSTLRLRLDEEIRQIQLSLKLAKKRENLKLKQDWAVTPTHLLQAILEESPNIVHFSGHGQEEGLVLQNEVGERCIVGKEGLSDLFKLFNDSIRCVVLNACYSIAIAQAIREHIPYVIGMKAGIPDKAAIAFSTGYYRALGAGRDIPFAFDLGIAAMKLSGSFMEEDIPILL